MHNGCIQRLDNGETLEQQRFQERIQKASKFQDKAYLALLRSSKHFDGVGMAGLNQQPFIS